MLIFQAIAYVQSPRLAGGVRSDLLFTILDLLKQAGLPLAVPTVMLSPHPAARRPRRPAPPPSRRHRRRRCPSLTAALQDRFSRASRAAATIGRCRRRPPVAA